MRFRSVERPERTIEFASRVLGWLPWIALFCTIVGARLWLISIFGSPLPFLDQWDAEAAFLFKPWLENTLRWPDLFAPHNEHRIVLTRLLALGLLQANGQWDALLEMTVNAVLCGFIGVGIAAGLLKILGREYRVPVLAAVTLWLALPFAHENTLWGFQSAFYFLLCFSFLAIWGLGFFPPYSWKWWLGAAGAALACCSTGSGFFAAGVVLILEAMRLLSKRRRFMEAAPTCLLAVCVLAVGLNFRVTFLPHEALKAESAEAWLRVFARSLAWPYCSLPILSVAAYLPWAICAFLIASNRTTDRTRLEILFALGIWVIIHAAAIAYARGEHGNIPISSRYMDILGLGAVVNALCVVALITTLRPGRRRVPALVLAAIWIAGSFFGAVQLGFEKLTAGPGREALLPMEENLRAYVATRDRKYLEGDRPYPDANRLANILDDPTIRKILPAVVRPALPVEIRQEAGDPFIPNGYPAEVPNAPYEKAWGSFSDAGPKARGSWESARINPTLPYLQFVAAGNPRGATALSLRNVETGKEARLSVQTRIDKNWWGGIVRVPGHPLHIIARDDSMEDWIAFREPRELGRLSYFTEQIISNRQNLFRVGVALLAMIITAGLLLRFPNENFEKQRS
jgi:hypothetical protein